MKIKETLSVTISLNEREMAHLLNFLADSLTIERKNAMYDRGVTFNMENYFMEAIAQGEENHGPLPKRGTKTRRVVSSS